MSQLHCLFFAELRELLDCGELDLPHIESESISQLVERLIEQGGERFQVLREEHVKVAVNSTIAKRCDALPVNSEVAFFPPVTGG